MAVLQANEIFFTAFEPKQKNRFIMLVDGIPSYQIKMVGGVTVQQASIPLNQDLSQLSSAYLTIFKNGGEVTVK